MGTAPRERCPCRYQGLTHHLQLTISEYQNEIHLFVYHCHISIKKLVQNWRDNNRSHKKNTKSGQCLYPEPLTLIAYWQVRDKISDKQVHLELETIGFEKLRGNREWFELSDAPQQDIECALSLLNKKFECLPVKESIVDSEQFTIKNYDEIWWGNNSPPPSLSC